MSYHPMIMGFQKLCEIMSKEKNLKFHIIQIVKYPW